MNARDRWLVNLGFDAGWDAHATCLTGGAGEQEPEGTRVEAGNEISEQPQAIRADAPIHFFTNCAGCTARGNGP